MIEHINPPSMRNNPAFSQGTIAPAGRTLYVGGQNGIDSTGALAEGLTCSVAAAQRGGATAAGVAKVAGHPPRVSTETHVRRAAGEQSWSDE